ncbi:MAG: sigma-54-dependent Fis family transcriptional regulator [Planctomyces sp.]|nr:sigma-54-dependent Fis family transcriptional regulator [Planctomyces sp.]
MSDAPPRILIVDDEPLFLRTTAALLEKAGYACVCASNGAAALDALAAASFDLVLSDLNMPGNRNLELLRGSRSRWPTVPLVVVTGAPSLPTAIESLRLGIADYLLKPVRYEDLLASVRRALQQPASEPSAVARLSLPGERRFPEIIGDSPPMQELFEIIERVAATDANVVITGESGTGKEIVANVIHRNSRRAGLPFQVIDCTAIPETLFESALFGHARGAFTGAVRDHAGLLSRCDGGTAFFDEIGELAGPLQSKLLRLIQEQTYVPVGTTTPMQLDARFLCATNRNLELEVRAGRFRRDLFYRLAVIHIELPPLRDRGDDALHLAHHFLNQLQPERPRVTGFSEAALELLRRYPWPGNVRELRNAIERGMAMARRPLIEPGDLPPALQSFAAGTGHDSAAVPPSASRAEILDDAERQYLISLLAQHSGNVAQSARQAGMSRQGFHKLLRKHHLEAGHFRSPT